MQDQESLIMNERELSDKQIKEFFVTIALVETEDEAKGFLEDLLTPEEIQTMAKRWCCARRLFEGIKQYDVVEKCHTSKNMVTRVNRAFIKNTNGVSRELFERLRAFSV